MHCAVFNSLFNKHVQLKTFQRETIELNFSYFNENFHLNGFLCDSFDAGDADNSNYRPLSLPPWKLDSFEQLDIMQNITNMKDI